ncbi:MAG: hypothetical protein ACUVQ0_03500 [Thermoproteota archaeon]
MKDRYSELVGRIIQLCDDIIGRNLDPFILDVKENLRKLGEGLSEMDEKTLVMNVAALLKVIYVIALQQDDVKKRASRLYLDPFIMEVRLMGLSRERLAEAFLSAFRPVAENEQATMELMRNAYSYWANLKEYRLPGTEALRETGSLNALAELLRIEEADFEEEMRKVLGEMGEGMIEYYELIGREGGENRIIRALALSFLMNRGLVGIVQDPLSSKVWVFKTSPKEVGRHSVALPI